MQEDRITAFVQGLGNVVSAIETRNMELKCPKLVNEEPDELRHAIIDMMTENTGCHICDSGGAYGRAWQRNRAVKDWDALPEIKMEAWDDKIIARISTYHFLNAFLEITEESKRIQKQFEAFCEQEEYKEESWMYCMEEFAEKILGTDYKRVAYTYNFENLLDHDIQYILADLDNHARNIELNEPIILLQIHTGVDARGGMTKPRVFTLKETDYFHMAMTDLNASCEKCGMRWRSDNCGYNWNGEDDRMKDKTLDGERDLEFRIVVDEDETIRHKGCGGKMEVWPQLEH